MSYPPLPLSHHTHHPTHSYGVWGDWERPYITLQPEYEAAQLRVFGDMFLKGHIYRWVL